VIVTTSDFPGAATFGEIEAIRAEGSIVSADDLTLENDVPFESWPERDTRYDTGTVVLILVGIVNVSILVDPKSVATVEGDKETGVPVPEVAGMR
jgi:hypothetical protein